MYRGVKRLTFVARVCASWYYPFLSFQPAGNYCRCAPCDVACGGVKNYSQCVGRAKLPSTNMSWVSQTDCQVDFADEGSKVLEPALALLSEGGPISVCRALSEEVLGL